MSDQAYVLRTLVADAQPVVSPGLTQRAPLTIIAGAKGGVGASTIAVNLSVALAGQGQRTSLVDVDLCRADVAALCGLTEKLTTADVLAARKSIHEVLQRGPGGIQVAPGAWAPTTSIESSPAAQRRLLAEVARLANHTDQTLIDVGVDLSDAAAEYWHAADQILLITTADSVAMMDAYAAVKVMSPEQGCLPIRLLVNQTRTSSEAWDVYRRINDNCQRFLDKSIEMAGFIPPDNQVAHAARQRQPFTLSSPNCAASQAIQRIAASLLATDEQAEQTREAV